MAKIEIWTRDVSGTSMLGNKAPQHIFLIKTNDNGTREIIRGGPSQDNMITGDIKIVNQNYNGIRQDDKITETYDYFDPSKPNILNYQGSTIKIASQSQIDAIWKNGLNKAQNINLGKFDYEPLTQNSNTVIYKISLEMNLGNEVKNFLDQKEVWAPGYGNDFTKGPVDKGWDYLYELPGDFKNDLTTIKNWIDDFKNTRQFENNEIKKSFNQKYSFEIFQGDKSIQLANSNLIASDAIYVDENNNPISLYDSLFVGKDSQMNSFTIIKNNIYTTLQDNSKATLDSIINTIDSASSSLISFINHQIEGIFEPIFKELFSTDESTKDANGDNSAQRLAGKILADLIQGKDITQIANDTTSQILIQNLLKDTSEKLASAIPTGPLKVDTAKFVQGTIASAIINFAIAVALDHKMDSDEYGTASANQNSNYHPKLNFNDNQKYQKKLVANDNYKNIFILSLIKNA